MATRRSQKRNGPGFRVQFARTDRDKDVVRRFRYKVLVDEMGRDPSGADHTRKEISSPLDDTAYLIMLKKEDDVVATARFNRGTRKGVFPSEFAGAFHLEKFLETYEHRDLALISSVLVAKDYVGTQAMALLLAAIYKMCRQQDNRFLFTSCDPFMVKAYERLGYRRYTGNFVDDNMGYQIPLVLLAEDIEYLQSVESPFARMAAYYPPNNDTKHWFNREFAEYASRPIEQNMTEEEYWQYLTEKMRQTPLVGIPLLKGLTFPEAKKFVNSGTVITCNEGDTIIRAGDKGDSMFVILSGKVAIKAPAEKGGRTFSTLKNGDIFGELAFLRETPRNADVVAIEPTEVLVLTQKFFHMVMERIPRIAMRVLFNMCIVLAERLHTSTEDLIAALGKEGSNEVDPSDYEEFDEYDDFDDSSFGSDRYGSGGW